MISSLKGILTYSGNNEILLDVNGVGYGVYVTKKVSDNLPPVEGELRILTYLDVKENALTLYGFYDEKEREIFKLLISVSGISSKSAHTILSHAGFQEIIGLITGKQSIGNIKIPGIGPKKLELISMTLKDKIFKLSFDKEEYSQTSGAGKDVFRKEHSRLDALNALMNLGYQRNEAEKIIREVLKNSGEAELTTEEIIKKSLEFIL